MKHLFFTLAITITSFLSFAANYPAKKTISKPVIDGNQNDACWNTASWAPIDQLWVGSAANNSYSGRFKVAWDDSLVYILVEVMDDIFHDTHSNPLQNYWDDDCIEIFVDENKSGGDHEFNFNAFAYHVSPFGDVVDYNTTGPALFNKNLKMDVDTNGNVYTWEVSMKIYSEKFDPNNLNLNRVNLSAGKVMGFSMAYNDSDTKTTRERMYGSQLITAADKNISYKTADAFGTLTLEAAPLGIDENQIFSGNKTFYNQETKRLELDSKIQYQSIIIYSSDGRKVNNYTLKEGVSSIELEKLEKGIYVIKLVDNAQGVQMLRVLMD